MSLRAHIAFTPAVQAAQAARGSRAAYARRLATRDWGQDLTPELMAYVEARDSFFLSTASADGQPYVQHRGGPPGFLSVLDPRTLAFADYAGNRQYISVGNLSENDRVMLLLMDLPARRRLKIWGRAELVEGEAPPALAPALQASAGARVERLLLIHVETWDLNCPQHITPRWTAEEIAEATPALRLVTLQVRDEAGYARYRAAMLPLLAQHGGTFELDVIGGEQRIGPGLEGANRALLLRFPNRAAAEAFFADPAYQAARARHFDPSVAGTAARMFP
ncbi:MAG: pyridoxamine 5'-phosphate oxidase family protein [Alphaproteobacteria bacterium]|nr:pyridoxamine 5'-phosphate oxidase family protein [Alphaproteobacteria bacterium]MCB9792145.1 pyridoxamine 5'-phosphate oxidase family protein [Alphaproteobacteria bacterium]